MITNFKHGGYMRPKRMTLKSILNSRDGIHLTAYLRNYGSVEMFERQIKDTLTIANEHLASVMPEEDLKRFLSPLKHLQSDSKLLKSFNSNIGIFRSSDSFRMLNVPVETDYLCVVATSFHVKPLLRWIQADKEFFMLGMDDKSVSIYYCTQSNAVHVDTIFISNFDKSKIWFNEWLRSCVGQGRTPLFLSGDQKFTNQIFSEVTYPYFRRDCVVGFFNSAHPESAVAEIRLHLQKETRQQLEKSLVEFNWAEEMKLGYKNIFQIARAAVKGKIRKLIVADGIQIFGKIDKHTGGIKINPAHLDHEDDDLLDDLAQTVLASGGEVIVVPRNTIPKGRPILAILKQNSKAKSELKEYV